jgi:hypothetical protein
MNFEAAIKLGVKNEKQDVTFRFKSEIPRERKVEYEILDENGTVMGFLIIETNPKNKNEIFISNVSIATREGLEKYGGKGYGKIIYYKLAEMLAKQGKVLVSKSINEDSRRVWNSLTNRGLAEKDPSKKAYDDAIYRFKSVFQEPPSA